MDFREPRILEVVSPERIQEFIVEQISVVSQTTENKGMCFSPCLQSGSKIDSWMWVSSKVLTGATCLDLEM